MAGASIFVDTNVFMRFFTADQPGMAEDCRQLLDRAERGELQLHTSHLVLAEIAWTLRSHYRVSRGEIATKLFDLLALRSLRIDQKEMLRTVVETYGSTNVDFIDAYHAVDLRRRGFDRICSYDRDSDALGVVRIEPSEV